MKETVPGAEGSSTEGNGTRALALSEAEGIRGNPGEAESKEAEESQGSGARTQKREAGLFATEQKAIQFPLAKKLSP